MKWKKLASMFWFKDKYTGKTEWVELLPGGHNRLARPEVDSIPEKAKEAFAFSPDWDVPLYGDGRSAETIVRALIDRTS